MQVVNVDLLDELLVAPSPLVDDLDVAAPLLQLLHEQFQERGTSNDQWVPEDDIRIASDACIEVMARLELVDFAPPFRDYSGFYDFWVRHGATGQGGWQARRELLAEIFGPPREAVRQEQLRRRRALVASGVTAASVLGWPSIDHLKLQVERRFRSASGPADYNAVGLDCVSLLEALSRTLYDPSIHLQDGDDEPPVDQSKKRLERVVEVAAPGPSNEDLRRLIKAAIAYAHHVKHQTAPNRQEAGMAADATILVTHLLRRLLGPEVAR